MLSENEKNGRKEFYRENGETPEDEAFRSGRSLSLLIVGMLTIAGLSLAYYLTH